MSKSAAVTAAGRRINLLSIKYSFLTAWLLGTQLEARLLDEKAGACPHEGHNGAEAKHRRDAGREVGRPGNHGNDRNYHLGGGHDKERPAHALCVKASNDCAH